MTEIHAVDIAINALSDALVQRDLLAADKETKIVSVIPPEVKQAMVDLDEEYKTKEATIAAEIERLTKEAKDAVLACGVTIEGAGLQLVYTTAKPQIKDMEVLIKFITDHPETNLGYLISMSKPSVSLRRMSGGV